MRAVLKLYTKVRKAESIALVQLQTGRVGLVYFLYKVGVPGYDLSLYSYGQADETPRHFLLYHPEGHGFRGALGPSGERSFLHLLGTLEGAQRTAKWRFSCGAFGNSILQTISCTARSLKDMVSIYRLQGDNGF